MIYGVILGITGAVLTFAFIYNAVPYKYITIMHEAVTRNNIWQLYGKGNHTGYPFSCLLPKILGDGIVLSGIVALNISLAVFFVITGAALGLYLTKSPWFTMLWIWVLIKDPMFRASALSELPALLTGTIFLSGLAGAWAWNHRHELSRWTVWTAAINLVTATSLALWIRADMGGIGLVALAAMAYIALAPNRLKAAIENHIIAVIVSLAILGVAYHILLSLYETRPSIPFDLFALLSGFDIFSLSFLNLPIFLGFSISLMFPVVVLLGLAFLFKHPLRNLLLPVAVIIIFQSYFGISHKAGGPYFEMFRYLSMLTPVLFFIGFYGWRFVQEFTERRGLAWWTKPLVLLVLVFGAINPQVHGMKELNGEGVLLALKRNQKHLYDHDIDHYVGGPINTNQQIEVRYLMHQVHTYPGCVFLAQVFSQGCMGCWPKHGHEYVLIAFGLPLKGTKSFPYDGPQSLQTAMRDLHNTDCVMFYRGMDCNTLGKDDCMAIAKTGKLVNRLTMPSLRYNWPHEYGIRKQIIHLELYKLR